MNIGIYSDCKNISGYIWDVTKLSKESPNIFSGKNWTNIYENEHIHPKIFENIVFKCLNICYTLVQLLHHHFSSKAK